MTYRHTLFKDERQIGVFLIKDCPALPEGVNLKTTPKIKEMLAKGDFIVTCELRGDTLVEVD